MDHVIRDEKDLENHLHYIHYNPVKHGFEAELSAWQYSSYSIWQDRGFYDHHQEWIEPDNLSWGE